MSQANWVKGMQPAAQWVVECGDRVVEVVRRMEARSQAVTPTTFKVLEQMRDKDDWEELVSSLSDVDVKLNPHRLKEEATKIMRKRWWIWTLLHPQLGPEDIHPSRSMFSLFIVAPTWC